MYFDHDFEPATEKQIEVLRKILGPNERRKIPRMSKEEAHKIIAHHSANWRTYAPTKLQEQFLRKHGRWIDGLKRGEAWDLIAGIKKSKTPGKGPTAAGLP